MTITESGRFTTHADYNSLAAESESLLHTPSLLCCSILSFFFFFFVFKTYNSSFNYGDYYKGIVIH